MYTVLIDEAGDVGLKGVQADPSFGPTQYFCICATIFNEDNRNLIEDALRALPFAQNVLHANKLNHFEKAALGRQISTLPLGMLGTISNKLSLLNYLPGASKTPTHFYNKVMQYLFERIGAVVGGMGVSPSNVRIRLEARAQQYSSLISFIDSIQRKPLDERSLPLRNLDRFSITSIKKCEDMCMGISDFGAHALFSAVRRDSRFFGLSETRYLHEVKDAFLASKSGKISGCGIKMIHSIDDLGLPEDTAKFFNDLRNSKKEYWRL